MHFMRLLQAKRNEQQWKITTPTGKNNLFNPLTWHLIAHLASLIDALYRCQSYIETNFFPAGFFFPFFWLVGCCYSRSRFASLAFTFCFRRTRTLGGVCGLKFSLALLYGRWFISCDITCVPGLAIQKQTKKKKKKLN